MNKLLIFVIAVLLICVGLSGCTENQNNIEDEYYYYFEMELKNYWQVFNLDFQNILTDSICNQTTIGYCSAGIRGLGNQSLGNGSIYRFSPEYNFHMILGIYEESSTKDSNGFYIESNALKIHKSDWTLTSDNNHIKFTFVVNETGEISVEEEYLT